MTSIQLYTPHTLNISIQFATEWNELLLPEIETIGNSIFLQPSSKENLFIELLKIRIAHDHPRLNAKKINQILVMLDIETLALECDPIMQFILTDIALTNNPLPKIGLLAGPTNHFDNLTVGEYEDADYYFSKYIESKEIAQAINLVSILWRIQHNNIRYGYINYTSPQSALATIGKLPHCTIMACVLWYIGCKAIMPRIFPLVFAAKGNTDTKPDPMAITKLIHSGAGVKNGTRAQIREMKLKEFLYECQLEAEAAIEANKK